jgi:uncharacterized protein
MVVVARQRERDAAPPKSERTTVKRLPERGRYDRGAIDAILDEGLICHVGFTQDGQPFVIPTIHARVGDVLYLHGSPASRMLRSLSGAIPVCVKVTLLDGLVLARSAFHHSMNYRSVVAVGTAVHVPDGDEKMAAFRALVDHVAPGRSAEARMPTPEEMRKTMLLRLPLTEASAKVRTGPPLDDDEDLDLPIWAGVVPLRLEPQEPIPDSELRPDLAVPPSVTSYARPQR